MQDKNSLRASIFLLLLTFFSALTVPHVSALGSPTSFTFGVAGDFSNGNPAKTVAALWGAKHPTLSIGLGDYSYASSPPANWCSSVWSPAVGSADSFLVVGDHDTYSRDRLTNDLPYGYWENSTGYANACGLKGSGVNWVGSGTISNNHPCNTIANLTLSDTCFGREMYVDYPAISPIVRFIVLCDGIPSLPNATAWCDYGSTGTDASNHFAWLDNTVSSARSQGIPWIIVLNHDHSFAAGPYGISYSANLWNHLITDKVDVFITAEEHNYQRSYPLVCQTMSHDWYQNPNSTLIQRCIGNTNKNFYTHGEGLLYLITGTGGQTHNRFNTTSIDWLSNNGYFETVNDTTWGFNLFNATRTTLTDTFTPAVGNFTDYWALTYSSPVGGTILGANTPATITLYATTTALATLIVITASRRVRKNSEEPNRHGTIPDTDPSSC